MHLFHVFILVVVLMSPLWKVCHNTLQVFNTIFACLYIIIAKVFCLSSWVFISAFTTKPKTRIISKNLCCLSHKTFFFRNLILEFWTILVTPLDSPLVVVVDTWEQPLWWDIVFRLSNIIETRIVHDRNGVPVFLNPSLIAEFLNRCSMTCTHIMTQTESMTYLVWANKTDELSHKFVIEFHALSTFVEWTTLCHIPFGEQVHNIVIPAYMTLNNLTRTWVDDMWTVGILYFCRQIAKYAITSIINTHVLVVLWPFLTNDGILETCSLKGYVPVVDTLNEIRNPFLWSCWVDIIYNLLLRFYELTLSVCFLVFWYKTIASSNLFTLCSVLIIVEIGDICGEISHTLVPQTLTHRFFRKKYHRGIQT